MKKLVGMTVVAFAFLLVTAAEPVQAQGYVGNGLGYWGIGHESFGQIDGGYRTGRIPTPPYFALHPPVYYSQPVHRSYGYSPFAYPGSVKTPEVVPVAAKLLQNPHVTPAKAKKNTLDLNMTSAAKQLEIINPFARPVTKMVSYE